MRHFPSRGRLFALWLVLFPAVLVLWYYPYIDLRIRVATWFVGFLILIGAIGFAWRSRAARWSLLAIYASVLLFLSWPTHRMIDPAWTRAAYCNALRAYTGCRYVWGGEGYLGVDCSGLVRKGMEDALAEQGLEALNPNALREAISLYWHDTNAKVIGEGYHGRTRFIMTCTSLNVLDYTPLLPGDLAVTLGGDHIMVYLGDKTWIEADPGPGKVTVFHIPEEHDAYFSTGMRIVRWNLFTD